eukprot:5488622-Pyramimonas_sp.AAC.1
MTSFYGSSCANNGKGALNTPEGFEEGCFIRALTLYRASRSLTQARGHWWHGFILASIPHDGNSKSSATEYRLSPRFARLSGFVSPEPATEPLNRAKKIALPYRVTLLLLLLSYGFGFAV